MALPSDSTFAVAMKTQQAAEREEQQRIKNLVLNYDLRDGEEEEGISPWAPIPHHHIHKNQAGLEKVATGPARLDNLKSGNNRSGQRARKLQLSDVDWYAKPDLSHVASPKSTAAVSVSVSSVGGNERGLQSSARPGAGNRMPWVPTKSGGRLSRREMLKEHSARSAALKDKE